MRAQLRVHLIDRSICALQADIWALHECDRIHAAIGQELIKTAEGGRGTFGVFSALFICSGRLTAKTGIIMSMHLYLSEPEGFSDTALPTTNLRLLCAYENGSVINWKYTRREKVKSVEGAGWEKIWNVKLHTESSTRQCLQSSDVEN